jgi:hypothetical protein
MAQSSTLLALNIGPMPDRRKGDGNHDLVLFVPGYMDNTSMFMNHHFSQRQLQISLPEFIANEGIEEVLHVVVRHMKRRITEPNNCCSIVCRVDSKAGLLGHMAASVFEYGFQSLAQMAAVGTNKGKFLVQLQIKRDSSAAKLILGTPDGLLQNLVQINV